MKLDKVSAILGIKHIVEELMKQDKKLTSLKTLQASLKRNGFGVAWLCGKLPSM